MGLFSRKNKIPDIGKEEELEEVEEEQEEEKPKKHSKKSKKSSKKRSSRKEEESISISEEKLEELKEKIAAIEEYTKAFQDRFSQVNQQIGEVRSETMSNEKSLAKLSADAVEAVDVVKQVKPLDLRTDYEKANQRVEELEEKIKSNKEMVEDAMKELEDFRRKSKIFIGTKGLLKLNDDVKKDLISVQKVLSQVKFNADKSENIFLEVKKGYADSQRANKIAENLNEAYSEIKKEMDKLEVGFADFPKREELVKLREELEEKIEESNKATEEFEKEKEKNKKLEDLIEKLVLASEDNRKEIEKLEKHDSKAGEDQRVDSILKVVEMLVTQMKTVKKKIGLHTKHIKDSSKKIKKEMKKKQKKSPKKKSTKKKNSKSKKKK